MDDSNIPVFAQAKIEYTKQLIDILYSHMYDGVKSIYDESKIIFSKRTSVPILLIFRELLEKVPIWNNEIIDSECSRIIEVSGCDWIEDLITAVFISHSKILTSIGTANTSRINVTIPKTTTFIHKSYINIARELWKNPYLFNENIPGHEYQRNNKEIENIIKLSIETTVRHLLPIKEILREHLDTYDNDSSNTSKEEVRQMLKEELFDLKNKLEETRLLDEYINEENLEDKLSEDNILKFNKEDEKPVIEVDNSLSLDNSSLDNSSLDNPSLDNPSLDNSSKINKSLIDNNAEKDNNAEQDKYINKNFEMYTLDGDPTDKQVEKQTDNIVVNDITIPVDIPDENGKNGKKDENDKKEINYDNKSLFIEQKEDKNRVNKLIENMNGLKDIENINIIKNNNIKETVNEVKKVPNMTEEIKNNSLKLNGELDLFSNMNNSLIPKTEQVNTTPVNTVTEIKNGGEYKKPILPIVPEKSVLNDIDNSNDKKEVKEVVNIENDNDIDETSSLANFFNDVKNIAESKGIKVDSSNNFVLFDDAPVVDPNTTVTMS